MTSGTLQNAAETTNTYYRNCYFYYGKLWIPITDYQITIISQLIEDIYSLQPTQFV